MKITWIGHSCFKVEHKGAAIVVDPYAPGSVPGLGPVEETAQAVLCSHGHGDHGYKEAVTIIPGDMTMEIETIDSWHDDVQGAKRGPNTIHILSADGIRIAHLGDLGCELSQDEKEKLMGLDVLMIPVGGFFTIDGSKAAKLVREVKPRIVIPMHYRDDEKHIGFPVIGTLEDFLMTMEIKPRMTGSCMEVEDELTKIDPGQSVLVMTPKTWIR